MKKMDYTIGLEAGRAGQKWTARALTANRHVSVNIIVGENGAGPNLKPANVKILGSYAPIGGVPILRSHVQSSPGRYLIPVSCLLSNTSC